MKRADLDKAARRPSQRALPRAPRKPARLNARLTDEQKLVLQRAANLSHQPLSQFVITSAQQRAEQVIREHEVIMLSVRDSQAVLEALRNPGPINPNLAAAAERYKAAMGLA